MLLRPFPGESIQTRIRRFLRRRTDPWVAHQYGQDTTSSFGFLRKIAQLHTRVIFHPWIVRVRFHGKQHGFIPAAFFLFGVLLIPTMITARQVTSEPAEPLETTQIVVRETRTSTESATPSAEKPTRVGQAGAKLPAGELGKIEDNAGYQFYYPYGLKVDTISTEPGSWSTVILTSPDRSGSILATVQGGSLTDWLGKVAPIDRFSSSMGGKIATKVLLPDLQTATAVESDGNVYVVTLKGGSDDQYWLEAYRTATTTFSFASFLGSQEDARARFGL